MTLLKKLGLLMVISMITINANAQEVGAVEIEKIIKSFVGELEDLPAGGAKKANEILSFVSPNFRYDSKVINIMNLVSHETMDYKKTEFILHQMNSRNITRNLKLDKIDAIHVRNNLAYARYSTSYELFDSERLINKGNQVVDLIIRKNPNNEWKIEWMNTIAVDDITYKSTCICDIYETKGLKNLITETIVPDGHEVDIIEDKFSIDDSVEPKIVNHGYRYYLWSSSGAIHKRKADGTQGESVGNGKSRQEMLVTLIKKEVYPDRCSQVIRKIK